MPARDTGHSTPLAVLTMPGPGKIQRVIIVCEPVGGLRADDLQIRGPADLETERLRTAPQRDMTTSTGTRMPTAPAARPVPCHAAVRLSIILPVLDEAVGIAATLGSLVPLRAAGHELIAVDGGSRDDTVQLCEAAGCQVFSCTRGRARQMNAGAALAQGDVLLFLHADTLLPAQTAALVAQAVQRGALWGRFDVRIQGQSAMLPVIAALMNLRSRWTGIATGDQAMFVQRAVFQRIGGFADQPLMEDIELSRRLRALGRPACLRQPVHTSGRRWESQGVWRTICLMWRLRWRYWRGVSPELLVKDYR